LDSRSRWEACCSRDPAENRSILFRRGLIWTAGALGSLFALAAALAAAIEAGYFRGALRRFVASHHRPLGIVKLDMEEAPLTLSRNDAGLANWQWTDPRVPDDALLPLVRRLSVPNARVLLKDDTRHLQFDGTITVKEPSPKEGPPPLRIEGTGQLNDKPVRFGIDGEPLC
jgi:hypothetical protein